METVRFAVAVILIISSVTPSNAATTPAAGGGGGDAHAMPCIQKLMPCQPYLHTPSPAPPPTCCMPLKEIVENDVTCLCSVFNNVDMLKSLNLTKENALVLPKACGASADVSQCKNGAGNTTSPAMSDTPPATSTGSDSTGASPTPSNSPPAINFIGLCLASAFMASAAIFL